MLLNIIIHNKILVMSAIFVTSEITSVILLEVI